MMSTARQASKIITLIVTCLGTFMVLLDGSIVTLALPTIQTSLNTSLADLQWTIDAYTLPFAALLLTAGTLGDRFGRKRMFLSGLVLFLIGSALCGIAPTFGWLIFGRVVQGMGAAALSPGSLSVLAAAFPEPRSQARVIGIWSGISGLSLAAGPLIGGLLIQVASWPTIFFVNLPIGLVAIVLGLPYLSESRNPHAQQIDLPGQVLVTAGLTCLIIGLIESSSQGWTSPLILGLFAGAAVLLVVFLVVESRVREPLLPLGLFANSVFSLANVATLILGFVILGVVFFLAQYFQAVQGSTALEAGLQTLPITVGTFLIAPLAGQLTARVGPRLPVIIGALLGGGALFLLVSITADSSYATVWWKLAMLGFGIGFMFSPLTVAVLSATPPTRAGLGSSMVSTSRQIGATLGVAVLGAFVAQQFANNITSQLTQLGISSANSTAIANKIASAGAQASQSHLSKQLPIAAGTLHQTISSAFVNALHGSFIISGVALLISALLVAFFLQRKPATSTSAKSTESQIVTADSAI